MKVPIKLGGDILRALAGQGETGSTKTRVLFLDEEMYGPMEFPKTFVFGVGQVLRLAAFGKGQVRSATMDTIHCTKEIKEELYDEYKRNPPTSDVDFSNDPLAGGIGADIARSIVVPTCGLDGRPAGESKPKPEREFPVPGDGGKRKTLSKFL